MNNNSAVIVCAYGDGLPACCLPACFSCSWLRYYHFLFNREITRERECGHKITLEKVDKRKSTQSDGVSDGVSDEVKEILEDTHGAGGGAITREGGKRGIPLFLYSHRPGNLLVRDSIAFEEKPINLTGGG